MHKNLNKANVPANPVVGDGIGLAKCCMNNMGICLNRTTIVVLVNSGVQVRPDKADTFKPESSIYGD